MTDHANGWSFLVARGRHRGYRTLLAPEFLTERHVHERLSESTSGGEPGRVLCIELDCPGVGPLTVTYTTDRLRPADVNGDGPAGGGAPTDEHGRPLELLYGIVSRDRLSRPLDEADLRAARSEALQTYRRFLAAEDSFGVDASRAFTLRTQAVPAGGLRRPAPDEASTLPGRAPPRPPDGSPRPVPGRSPAAPAVVAGALAAIALLGWLLWPAGAPEVRILNASVAGPKEPVACGMPVSVQLRAEIEARGATEVRYHWEPTTPGESNDAPLLFKAAGKNLVRTTRTVPQAGAGTKVGFRLVIAAPVKTTSTLTYRTSCRNGPRR